MIQINQKNKDRLIDYIGTVFVFIMILIAASVTLFAYTTPVAVYSDTDETVYGYSSLFQRFINTNYIKIIDISTYNYTTQSYDHQWTSIVTYSDNVYWFYDRYE